MMFPGPSKNDTRYKQPPERRPSKRTWNDREYSQRDFNKKRRVIQSPKIPPPPNFREVNQFQRSPIYPPPYFPPQRVGPSRSPVFPQGHPQYRQIPPDFRRANNSFVVHRRPPTSNFNTRRDNPISPTFRGRGRERVFQGRRFSSGRNDLRRRSLPKSPVAPQRLPMNVNIGQANNQQRLNIVQQKIISPQVPPNIQKMNPIIMEKKENVVIQRITPNNLTQQNRVVMDKKFPHEQLGVSYNRDYQLYPRVQVRSPLQQETQHHVKQQVNDLLKMNIKNQPQGEIENVLETIHKIDGEIQTLEQRLDRLKENDDDDFEDAEVDLSYDTRKSDFCSNFVEEIFFENRLISYESKHVFSYLHFKDIYEKKLIESENILKRFQTVFLSSPDVLREIQMERIERERAEREIKKIKTENDVEMEDKKHPSLQEKGKIDNLEKNEDIKLKEEKNNSPQDRMNIDEEVGMKVIMEGKESVDISDSKKKEEKEIKLNFSEDPTCFDKFPSVQRVLKDHLRMKEKIEEIIKEKVEKEKEYYMEVRKKNIMLKEKWKNEHKGEDRGEPIDRRRQNGIIEKWKIPGMEAISDRSYVFFSENKRIENPLEDFRRARMVHKSWSEQEVATFLEKFQQYPKDLRRISTFLPNKTPADVINYYYIVKHSKKFKKILKAIKKKRGYRKRIINEGKTPQQQQQQQKQQKTTGDKSVSITQGKV